MKKKILYNKKDPKPNCMFCEYSKEVDGHLVCLYDTNKQTKHICVHYSYDLLKRKPINLRLSKATLEDLPDDNQNDD